MCFDNSFSKFSEKMVFFEVNINSESSSVRGSNEWENMAITESMGEYKMEDIRVRKKIKELCMCFRSSERQFRKNI